MGIQKYFNSSVASFLIFVPILVFGQFETSHHGKRAFQVSEGAFEIWIPFDGKVIRRLEFVGLTRTNPKAARWLVRSQEETVFSSKQLERDVQELYNSGVLYDITPVISTVDIDSNLIDIQFQLKDKWTLFPFFGARGGGGSVTYAAGVFEGNFLGYLVQSFAVFYTYNNAFSYDVRAFQDHLGGTDFIGRVRVANTVEPTVVHHIDNSSAGQYAWRTRIQEIQFGKHFDKSKFTTTLSNYRDEMIESKGVNAFVYPENQYSIQPRWSIGRINYSDYLEEGSELSIFGSAANFLGKINTYQKVGAQYKYVGSSGRNGFGFFVQGQCMTPKSPPAYHYEVGGYTSVRGYTDSRQIGPYMYRGNFEYRQFLFTDRWNFLGLDMIAAQAVLFTDLGSAWGDETLTFDNGAKQSSLLWSTGMGIRFHFVKFAGAVMRLDAARTIRPDEGWGASFGVGHFF